MEHEEETGFVALHDDGDVFSGVTQRRQQWRRSRVVIPEIVMHELESPSNFAGFCVQSHDGIRPLVVAAPARHSLALASPVAPAKGVGTGFQLHRSVPERASKARTTPAGMTARWLSSMADPTTTRSSITVGGEVM